MAKDKQIQVDEIKKHNSDSDCWLVVNDNVWDLTEFAPEHPGGAAIIYKYAGRDASEAYNSIHAPSLLSTNLRPEDNKGKFDTADAVASDPEWLKPPPSQTRAVEVGAKPPLQTLINSYDFEEVASRTVTAKTWAFYSSAATDLITRDANKSMFDRIWFRPRLMRDVKHASTKTKILGCEVDLPFFVSPAAMAKLVHPDGEKALALGCASKGVAQCISSNASFPVGEITSTVPGHPFFFQLYVNKDRPASEKLLKEVEAAGVKAIFVTVDAPVPGKREADERVKADAAALQPVPNSGATARNDAKGGGLGRTMGGYIDPTLSWKDVKWLRRSTKLPIVLKGVQSASDVKLAMDYGLDGVVLSNHGGRNLDTAPPSILTLLEVNRLCPEVFSRMEIFVDSGIRRGTDILKCLCLGAKAVGMGRPFLYSVNYGAEGVEHFIEIMRDELETSMRMVGINTLEEAHRGLVNTLDLDHLVPSTMGDGDMKSVREKSKL